MHLTENVLGSARKLLQVISIVFYIENKYKSHRNKCTHCAIEGILLISTASYGLNWVIKAMQRTVRGHTYLCTIRAIHEILDSRPHCCKMVL